MSKHSCLGESTSFGTGSLGSEFHRRFMSSVMFVQILVRESVTTNRGIDMERQYLVNFLKDSVITAERPNMTPVG